jgi:T4 RnlA family RNA ligase
MERGIMKVIEYLNGHSTPAVAIEGIKAEYGIKVREYWEEMLFVFNYDQIKSPKTDPIVKECRGLILTYGQNKWEVVSRSFDRFYNAGEAPEEYPHFDITKATCYEKVDGSLIKIYHYRDKWHISTRGTAFAETNTPMGVNFKGLVLKALDCNDDDEFQCWCIEEGLNEDYTEVFEITCRENRVVTRYEGYKLWYLSSRENSTGKFDYIDKEDWNTGRVYHPQVYTFDTLQAITESSKNLPNLQEGYVCYQEGVPTVKVKSPAYVAVHHIRGEGTPSPKRIMQLLLMNEQEEYLKYFPEDQEFFTPYEDALEGLLREMSFTYDTYKGEVDQKQFALHVKDNNFSGVLFKARQAGEDVIECFHSFPESYKIKVLEGYIET